MILLSLGENLLLIGLAIILIGACLAFAAYFKKKKSLDEIYCTLTDIAGIDNVKRVSSKIFDFDMDYNNKKFLIKMIYHPSRSEINVNSKDYWQVNEGSVSSRKSGTQMLGVYDLLNFDLEKNNYDKKTTVKLYIIYPCSNRLLKVINECEMEFIKPQTDIYGCRVNNFTDIKEKIDQF
jgi:hypothetical protein